MQAAQKIPGPVGIDDQTLSFSHYEIRSRIGEGGQGEVYEAWDTKLCRSVAIKRIKGVADDASAASLVQEARLAASLHHPAFVKVHAIEEDGNDQSIVMELVPGSSLGARMRSAPVAPAQAFDWLAQIAEAMQAAHASGLVHGDLKPSNLMVEPGGRIRILDFGLASRSDPLATVTLAEVAPRGTIAYMSPERLHGAAPGAQSDIYALGVILYELLCGSRPFADLQGLALAAAQAQTSSDAWNYPPTLPPSHIELIRAMTARRLEHRLATMEEVRLRIAALDGADPARLAPQRRAPWRASPAARRWLAGGGLALLLLGLGWQAAPYLRDLPSAALPYSEAREMEQGLSALKLYDRPGSLDAAIAHFDTILAHNPNHAAAAASLSLAHSLRYVSDGRDEIWLQKADAGAQQALLLDQQLALSHIAQGWVLDNQGKLPAALERFERALALDPNNYFALHGKALVLRHMRRYPDALAHVKQSMQAHPAEQVFSNEFGTIHYEQGDYKTAEQAFRRSIEMQPDSVFAYANLNAALLRQNRGDEALQVLQQGLQVRHSAKLYGNLGNALFLRGDYVGAASAFEHAVSPTRGAPGDYLNWANLADALRWIPGRSEQTRKAYEKAMRLAAPRLERAPDDVTLVSRMGLYAARVNAKSDAEPLIEKAQRMAPQNADVHFRAGLAHELLGNRAQALAAIGKARTLGYPEEFIEAEPDLVHLRRDPAYPSPHAPAPPPASRDASKN